MSADHDVYAWRDPHEPVGQRPQTKQPPTTPHGSFRDRLQIYMVLGETEARVSVASTVYDAAEIDKLIRALLKVRDLLPDGSAEA